MSNPPMPDPACSPEGWTAYLAACLRKAFAGGARTRAVLNRRSRSAAVLVGRHVIEGSTVRSWALRGWVEHEWEPGARWLVLTDAGRAAVAECSACNGKRVIHDGYDGGEIYRACLACDPEVTF